MDGRTLWEALNSVPDRRGRKGRQYPLRSVLGISLAAMLAGANDLRAIFRWGRRLKPEALLAFGIESGKAPCHATYHYFFAAMDADALAATLGRYALGDADPGHMAIDGKTLRGSRRGEEKALHVLSAFAVELSAVGKVWPTLSCFLALMPQRLSVQVQPGQSLRHYRLRQGQMEHSLFDVVKISSSEPLVTRSRTARS